ncbi:MAG: ComEC/Rec2 family competence protein, partial [Bacteroidota bacterium]|nr:ComEC/Rec2 family competence protein [Bacteroidota bacterium]
FNSLAASAFLLLCYNPYLLWDVGFQLSYFAIIGIITFQKPIYKKIYIKNKLLNKVWQLMTVAIAAQIFTFPACLYYFHQFPVLFFITNLIVVPLATIILYAEIVLIISSFSVFIVSYIGKVVSVIVWLMNATVLFINSLPFSLWDGVAASVISTLLLYCLVFCICFWLLNKNKFAFKLSMFTLFVFTALTAYTKWQTFQQQKLIVYNVPQHEAIDFINANEYKFIGDSVLMEEGMLQNFHLKPGRIALQLNKKVDQISPLHRYNNFYQFNDKKILLIDKPIEIEAVQQKINVDYIIISKNPKLYISQLANIFKCDQIIFDGSNSLWKIDKWKKDCEQLHLRCFSVPEEGAFVSDL